MGPSNLMNYKNFVNFVPPPGSSSRANGVYMEERADHGRESDNYYGRGREDYSAGWRDDSSGRGREYYGGRGREDYRGGGREDYSGSGREDYVRGREDHGGGREDHGRGMEDTYIKERIVDKVESGSSVAVRRGGFVFRRLPDPEESDLKKKVEETCKDKKKFEDMLELQKKKNFEVM